MKDVVRKEIEFYLQQPLDTLLFELGQKIAIEKVRIAPPLKPKKQDIILRAEYWFYHRIGQFYYLICIKWRYCMFRVRLTYMHLLWHEPFSCRVRWGA